MTFKFSGRPEPVPDGTGASLAALGMDAAEDVAVNANSTTITMYTVNIVTAKSKFGSTRAGQDCKWT